MRQFSGREFVQRFEKFVTQHHLITKLSKIVVAVSGGADSVVLLDLLSAVRKKYTLDLIAAHFNHQLRGKESNIDEKFVQQLAQRHGIEFCRGSADVKAYCKSRKLSVQEGARELRYQFLQDLCTQKHFQKIATAHNADDNAETILLHLFRGTGISGLSGIPAKRDNIVRPILFATREEIESYAEQKGIRFRTDSTNLKEDYRRNFIRLRILPLVKKHVNPNVLGTLNRTAEICGELNRFVRLGTESAFETIAVEGKDRIALDISKLKNYLYFVQCSVVIWGVKKLSEREIDYEKVNSVLRLVNADTGSSLNLFEDLIVYKDRSSLVFVKGGAGESLSVTVRAGETYSDAQLTFSSEVMSKKPARFSADHYTEYVDADTIGKKLTLRTWRNGDWLIPLGMKGKKKVSDFLIDAKIPVYDKQRIIVVETGGKIVWLCGLRLDERFKVSRSTRRILKLRLQQN